MSNEPNEAEKNLGVVLYTRVRTYGKSTFDSPDDAARFLAAHRPDESELAKALEELKRYYENPDTQFAVPAIDIIKDALAAHAATKS